MKKILLLAAAWTACVCGAQDLKLSPDNVDKVIKAMTPEEKAGVIVGKGSGAFDGRGHINDYLPGCAGATNPIDRLGIPPLVYADGPSGLRVDNKLCTRFPNGMLEAATWNTQLLETIGEAEGREFRARGIDVVLGPGMNIQRNPLCGRNFEYFSEDPLLSGLSAAALVRGIQRAGVGACPKHFAANNQELNRLSNDSRVSRRALREIYLRNFEIMVKSSQPWFIMSSYNFLNGVTTSQNRDLLTTILRHEWGFSGAVISDWGGGYSGAQMVKAGNDNIQQGSKERYNDILNKLKDGYLDAQDLDACVKRMLQAALRAIRYKGGSPTDNPPLEENASLVREAAPEGFVLLENHDNALPLKKGDRVALMGTTSYDFIHGGTGSGTVNNPFRSVCMPEGLTDAGLKLDEAMHRFYTDFMQSERRRCENFNKNVPWCCEHERAMEAVPTDLITKAAKEDKAAVITLGRVFGEGVDRDWYHSYMLSNGEIALLKAAAEAFHKEGKPVIVVLNVGGIIDVASWRNLADAILICWQPGEEGGHSVGDVLAGNVSPSGRMPVTIPMQYSDDPSAPNFPQVKADKYQNYSFYRHVGATPQYKVPCVDYTNYEEGIYVGYRHYVTRGVKTAYPFGYGLSYTTFDYRDMKIKDRGDRLEIGVTVKNTGKRAGKEVVQIYCDAPEGGMDKPLRELKGYAKTRLLKPGQEEKLTIVISKEWLTSFDEDKSAWIACRGEYAFIAARDADTPVLQMSYKLNKDIKLKVHDVLGIEPLFVN
ncbi:MAG: glycoside hydrolase family 3 C-terminal domain-containing protein [Bacteroidaceae bacterium]|nr:glycoside hydrolase family 3 C-terminal domain-containing protein [Bacteroidaceae bacterium]